MARVAPQPYSTPRSRRHFAQRASEALRALSLRWAAVKATARAWPPLLAPRRPSATACGFFFFVLIAPPGGALYFKDKHISGVAAVTSSSIWNGGGN